MKRLIFGSTIFVLGVLLGAALTVVLIGNRIDTLYIENRSLRDSLTVIEKEIIKLQETHQKAENKVISGINTYINFAEDCDFTEFEKSTIELTVEKKVRVWLDILSGQDVNNVNYLLVPQIIDNREIEIEGKRIRLTVKLVVVSEKVRVYLDVVPLKYK